MAEKPADLIAHVREFIRDRSWVTKYFGWTVIVGICLRWAREYFDEPIGWNHWIDRAVFIAGFFILLVGSLLREFLTERRYRYAHSFDHTVSITEKLKELDSYLSEHPTDKIADPEEFRSL